MGGVDELLVVLVDMFLEGGGGLVADCLNLGLALHQFWSAHAFLDQVFDVCKVDMDDVGHILSYDSARIEGSEGNPVKLLGIW